MDRKLYCCEIWPHKKVFIEENEYEICISPKIDGNAEGTSIQYHGAIIRDNMIMRLGFINKMLSLKQADHLIISFEEKIRNILRSKVTWIANATDNGTVKIWYYEENDKMVNTYEGDKRRYPPLRFAITVININPLDEEQSNLLREELENMVIEWIGKVLQTV